MSRPFRTLPWPREDCGTFSERMDGLIIEAALQPRAMMRSSAGDLYHDVCAAGLVDVQAEGVSFNAAGGNQPSSRFWRLSLEQLQEDIMAAASCYTPSQNWNWLSGIVGKFERYRSMAQLIMSVWVRTPFICMKTYSQRRSMDQYLNC